jgi:hypothetical protein
MHVRDTERYEKGCSLLGARDGHGSGVGPGDQVHQDGVGVNNTHREEDRTQMNGDIQ